MKELHFIIVQDVREVFFLKSIAIGFGPEHFTIYITNDIKYIDQIA